MTRGNVIYPEEGVRAADKRSDIMKKCVLIFMLLVLSMTLTAGKAAVLKGVVDPAMIEVKDGKLYVLQRTTIFIYSLKDFKLIKQFGKEGEGPREFMINPFGPPMSVMAYDGRLVINSINKMSYFSSEGEYLREHQAPPNTVFVNMKGGFLGIGAALIEQNSPPQLAFRLFDKDFKPGKVLYATKIKVGNLRNILLPMEALHYNPYYKGKLYVANSREGFVIDCFDLSGKKLYSIKKDYEKIAVGDDYKQAAKEWFKTDPNFRRIWDIIKSGLTYETYYPAIKELYFDNDIIYAFTHKQKNKKNECILMDLKGKELARTYLPMPESDFYTYYPLLITIDNNKYYRLEENEDDEVWELFAETIRKK
jgi:hypothetical protein